MKLNKLIILIAISLILTLVLIVLVRENQHLTQIENYLEAEIQRESSRLETYNESTKNYNELQEERDRLYIENRELKEKDNWQLFEVTGYSTCDGEQGTNNIVATNFNLDLTRVKNLPIIATDPEIIPLYSIVEIKDIGAYISLDVGGAIKGNRIDILFNSREEAREFGRQELMARVIK